MKHRPLQRERLTRRQTAFAAHLLFELFSFATFTENHVCSLPPGISFYLILNPARMVCVGTLESNLPHALC
jgi:hypothetical protein